MKLYRYEINKMTFKKNDNPKSVEVNFDIQKRLTLKPSTVKEGNVKESSMETFEINRSSFCFSS
jgi:hypothetical protein